MRRFEIDLPLPPPECSPNGNKGGSWRKKGNAVKSYRMLCALLVRQALAGKVSQIPQATIHLHFYLCRPKTGQFVRKWGGLYHAGQMYFPRDEDNARISAKPVQDALVDAGLLPGDSAKFVRAGETRILSTAKQHGGKTGLVVIVEEITEGSTAQ